MRTPGVKKAFSSTSEKLRLSSREKNPVTRLGYNEYMAHHYAFAMKVVVGQELTGSTASLHRRLEGEKPDLTIKPKPKPATQRKAGNPKSKPVSQLKPAIKRGTGTDGNRTETGRPDTGSVANPIPAIRSRSRFNRIEDPDNAKADTDTPQLELEGEC